MCKKFGFTLVEMLFVVVIAAGILVFAVPAYKRVQEKANYNAALGVLLDVNNAVNSLKRDLKEVASTTSISFPIGNDTAWSFPVNAAGEPVPLNTPEGFVPADPWNVWLTENMSDDNFWGSLFRFGYLKEIQDTKGYNMHIIHGVAPEEDCRSASLPAGVFVQACMLKAGTTKDCYKGALLLSDGSVRRIKGNDCSD